MAEKVSAGISKAMNRIGFRLTEALKNKLTQAHGKDTGSLQSSIRWEWDGTALTIYMDEVGKYLEYGTPPHFPPPEELEGWADRKLDWTDSKGRPLTKEQKAFMLAVIISKQGTKPYPFIRNTIQNEAEKIIVNSFKDTFK